MIGVDRRAKSNFWIAFSSVFGHKLCGVAQGIQKGKQLKVLPTYEAVVTSFPFWRRGVQLHDFINFEEVLFQLKK